MTMKVVYAGPDQDGVDIPDQNIVAWKPGEVREVPDELGKELLSRGPGEFREPTAVEKKRGKPEE